MDTRNRVIEKYSIDAAGYDAYRLLDPRGSLLSDRDVNIFNRLIQYLDRSGKALEIGAGTGRFTIPSLNYFENLIASDINQEMLNRLSDRVENLSHKDRVSMKIVDLFNMPFLQNSFDSIFALHVIPRMLTLEDQEASIRAMAKVLRPKGRLLFNFRNRNSIYGAFISDKDAISAGRGYAIPYLKMLSILDETGLQLVAATGKHILARQLLDILPVAVGRCVSGFDCLLERLGAKYAWDVFLVVEKKL